MDILSSLLSQKISDSHDKQSDFERVFWFTQVMKWVQRPRSSEEKKSKRETVYTVRLKYLLLLLNKNPAWQLNFITSVKLLLLKISSASQLTSAGLPESVSFVQEFIHRLQEKILPKPQLSEDLSTLIYEIFPHEEESLYIDFIDADVLNELFKLFDADEEMTLRLNSDLLTASYILSHQILNHSLMIQKELNLNPQPQDLAEFQLEGALREHQISHNCQISPDLLIHFTSIEHHMRELYEMMKERGVKIELVYLFQIQRRKLNRLRALIQFLNPQVSSIVNFRSFISHLVLETQHQKSLTSFFSENLALITERIVQTNSHIGEHYVTFTWTEFRKMFHSAIGGGAVTSVTVFLKLFIAELKFVGFFKGFVDSLNYSGSFLTIQLMGWTLATKQPSTTALYIASALQKSTTESRKSIVALLRTQFIAVIGNLSSVFPICFLISWIFYQFQISLISKEEAMHSFYSTNILGPSALYATFTGLLLFLASLFAGWFENWILVNHIDKRIKYNDKLQSYFGRARIQKFSEFLAEKSNPLAGNISLGFLLGMTPQIMKFLGIPLEARHVTLATGAFAAALPTAIAQGVNSWEILNAVLGIMMIGILNLSVSFALAFLLASLSTKVRFSSFWRLLKWGMRLIVTRPWLLVVPEKTKASAHKDEDSTKVV